MKHTVLCSNYSGCSVVGFDRSTHHHFIEIDAEHLSSKALLHMLFHILGRYHEHERSDRKKHVQIIEDNIMKGIIII